MHASPCSWAVLVLLDERTWTSGDDTAKLVEHIHAAMRIGVHINCVHESPSVIGPPRHACEFGRMVRLACDYRPPMFADRLRWRALLPV